MTRWLGSFLLAVTLVACSGGGSPVAIRTVGAGDNVCFTSGTAGDLVTDPASGTAIIEAGGRRVPVTWPTGWTGRSSGSEVEVLDRTGEVAYRTGTHVDLAGGYRGEDRSFLVCGLELIP
jgi:hypothetical protein